MAVAMTCADQMQLLHRVIEKAKQVPQPSAAMAHELSEIEKLERTGKGHGERKGPLLFQE